MLCLAVYVVAPVRLSQSDYILISGRLHGEFLLGRVYTCLFFQSDVVRLQALDEVSCCLHSSHASWFQSAVFCDIAPVITCFCTMSHSDHSRSPTLRRLGSALSHADLPGFPRWRGPMANYVKGLEIPNRKLILQPHRRLPVHPLLYLPFQRSLQGANAPPAPPAFGPVTAWINKLNLSSSPEDYRPEKSGKSRNNLPALSAPFRRWHAPEPSSEEL